MIHRTFRSLDQPPKLLGFTIGQWAALVSATVSVGGLAYTAGLAAKAAITLFVFLVGVPAALMYVSESGGLSAWLVLRDLVRWRLSPRALLAHGDLLTRSQVRLAARIPGVARITLGGLLVRSDGGLVRYLAVSPVNPLVLDPAEAERVATGFSQVAARLQDHESLQLYVTAIPLRADELLAAEAEHRDQASIADGLAASVGRLGELTEESLGITCRAERPLSFSYVVVCPWTPRVPRFARPAANPAADEEASRRHTIGISDDLVAAGLTVQPLDGPAVLDLIGDRLDPARIEGGAPPASLTAAEVLDVPDGIERLRTAPLQIAACELILGGRPERCAYVSLAPEQTWLGWLLHLMSSDRPFTVAVHITATERHRERMLQRRRYRRVYGVNRGVEARGQLLDPDARAHEQDALELNDELASTSGAGIYQMGIYAAMAEPGGDSRTLGELARTAGRELSLASDARVDQGMFLQLPLWLSTLPLGADVARRQRKYVAANVGDSFPLLGSTVSSPAGIPVGIAFPGRSLVRLDPFDPAHPNHLLLINGMSGSGKTMSAIVMLARAIGRGASGCIIDRAGHFEFLASLIPGAASVELGADQADAINCWDVPDPAQVGPEKIDYLLALHALLLGEHDQGRDSYGLTDLEANLLGLAITDVYQRCVRTGELPRELLLQQELERRFERERAEGSDGIAEALRNLSMRLSNYVDDGPYAYLTDRATTVSADAPLVVFDTRSIPDAKAAAALFVICEHVKSRIERTRARHLAGDGAAHAWAGRSFLVVDEAWKLIERPATGRWFNEFCRRSRHYALWLVAISQQLSDFENEYGRALLANAAMRLFLRQETRELAYVTDALGLSGEAVAAIGELNTVRGAYADAYLMNGTRGQGQLRMTVGPGEYWVASSDPACDEPARRRALRESGGDPWRALELLAERHPAGAGVEAA